MRKLRGPMADWSIEALLLRGIEFQTRAANWQRAGGKGGSKPKPIELPDGKGRGGKPAQAKMSGPDVARRLLSMGLLPAGTVID